MKPHALHLLAATLGCGSGELAEGAPRVAQGSASSGERAVPVMYASSPGPIATVPEAPDPFAQLLPRVEQRAVPIVGRRVLLSWTTREQAEEIAAGGPLLSRVESPLHGPSGFDWMLDANVAKGQKLAKLLFRDHYARKRFAWPNAYATASGAGGGRYGSVLMRIELREDALILDLPMERVLTVDNREVPFAELEAKPERLAAVYWDEGAFREYVLVNESAIARVSSGTPEALAIFRAERELLVALATAAPQLSRHDQLLLTVVFERTLAFSKNPTIDQIRAMAREASEVAPDGLQFSFVPKAAFVASGAQRRLTNPGCKQKRSNDFSYHRISCVPDRRCRMVDGKCEITRTPVRELERRD